MKKAKNERASSSASAKSIGENSSSKEVDAFLKEKYGYGLWEFILSLYAVYHLFAIMEEKKRITSFQTEIIKLKTAKRRIVEDIDQFMVKTGIWEALKKDLPENSRKLTATNREKYISSEFNLGRYFKYVEGKVDYCNNAIKLLKKYGLKIQSLRIKPKNFAILLWTKVMKNKRGGIDFENIQLLFNWFLNTRGWKGYFSGASSIAANTPRLTYNKYIKFAKNDLYDQLTFMFFIDYFFDITEPLKRMFPDPLKYMQIQSKGAVLIAKTEMDFLSEKKRGKSNLRLNPVKKRA